MASTRKVELTADELRVVRAALQAASNLLVPEPNAHSIQLRLLVSTQDISKNNLDRLHAVISHELHVLAS